MRSNSRSSPRRCRCGSEDEANELLERHLDHFKVLNDVHGHERGNEALAVVGQTLGAGVRVSDFAGRYGGEEFLLLLPDTDRDSGVILAEKLRVAIAQIGLPEIDGGSRRASASRPCRTRVRRGNARARGRPRALPGARRTAATGWSPLLTRSVSARRRRQESRRSRRPPEPSTGTRPRPPSPRGGPSG